MSRMQSVEEGPLGVVVIEVVVEAEDAGEVVVVAISLLKARRQDSFL